jgi:hypothetical protein
MQPPPKHQQMPHRQCESMESRPIEVQVPQKCYTTHNNESNYLIRLDFSFHSARSIIGATLSRCMLYGATSPLKTSPGSDSRRIT